jgi:adenylate cyclase
VNENERRRQVRLLTQVAWGRAIVGNLIAGITIGVILAVSSRIYFGDVPFRRLMAAFSTAGLMAIVPILIATWFMGRWAVGRRLSWFIEERPPSRGELERFAALPRLVALANFPFWVLMAVAQPAYVSNVIDAPLTPFVFSKTFAVYAFGFVIGSALAYLFMERAFRPYLRLMLPEDIEDWPRSIGLRARLLTAWFAVGGAPLLLIAFNLSGLTSPQRDLAVSPLIITSMLTTFVGLLVFVAAGRTITAPLERLRSAQRLVAAGDLTASVEIDEAGEIGQLEAGFNEMVDGLRERDRMRDVFGRHVGTDVARLAMERNPTLGGEVCDATALFVDVIGSTRIAEHREPDEVVSLLNDFFETVVRVVGTEGGFVNQFQGDGALCLFGAPVPQEDHRARGLRAARALLHELASMEGLEAAIGVSSGRVVAGNVGSSDRYEFTVIGDPVNEASRLSDEAKRNSPRVLASEQTVARAESEGSLWSKCKDIQLRGRSVPTAAYSPESA